MVAGIPMGAIKMSFTHAFLQYPSVLLLFFFPLLRESGVCAPSSAGLCKHDETCRGNSKRYHHLLGMKQHKLADIFNLTALVKKSSLLNLKVDRRLQTMTSVSAYSWLV